MRNLLHRIEESNVWEVVVTSLEMVEIVMKCARRYRWGRG
jgi:hypothetical protein